MQWTRVENIKVGAVKPMKYWARSFEKLFIKMWVQLRLIDARGESGSCRGVFATVGTRGSRFLEIFAAIIENFAQCFYCYSKRIEKSAERCRWWSQLDDELLRKLTICLSTTNCCSSIFMWPLSPWPAQSIHAQLWRNWSLVLLVLSTSIMQPHTETQLVHYSRNWT